METQATYRNMTVSELLNVVDQTYGRWTSPLVAELADRLLQFHRAGYDRPDDAEPENVDTDDERYHTAVHTAREQLGGIINKLEESQPFDLMGELRQVEDELDV